MATLHQSQKGGRRNEENPNEVNQNELERYKRMALYSIYNVIIGPSREPTVDMGYNKQQPVRRPIFSVQHSY